MLSLLALTSGVIRLRDRPAFNPSVAALPPYNAGMNVEVARRLSGRDETSPASPATRTRTAARPRSRTRSPRPPFEPSRYADPACTALRGAIANDTGALPETIVCGNGLEEMIAVTPPRTLFVLDEAYFEYADAGGPDGIDVLRDAGIPHVVLRAFSKAYGLAGLRAGYAVCSDEDIARVVAAAKTPFDVNAAAQIAALAALDDEAWMQASVGRLRAERARVRGRLEGLGFRVAPSQTNFLFFDCAGDSADLAAALLEEGIIVKAWREPGFTAFVRATIGTPADNDRPLAAWGRRACA